MNGRRACRTAVLLGALGLLALATATALTNTGRDPAVPAGSSTARPSDGLLSVVQTSTMVGLAPYVPPVPISGHVVNHRADSTYVVAVEVEITSVTPAPGAPGGSCSATDYLLDGSRMPVGRTLGPGGSTTFTGASIEFSTTDHNQDACKHATVHLRYTATSS